MICKAGKVFEVNPEACLDTVEKLYRDALQRADALIPAANFEFTQTNNDGKLKHYCITPVQYRKALQNKYSDFEKYKRNFVEHLLGLRNLVAAFASTPTSFTDAWNMKSKELTADDVIALTKSGGHFQFNQLQNGDRSGSALYQRGGVRGLVKSKDIGITKGFRHATGGMYEQDQLNEMGTFNYATPTDPAGMMEYRMSEQLSATVGIPQTYLITQWFRYSTPCENLNDFLYMTGVAKVINTQGHPYDPIELQLISKDEALKHIDSMLSALRVEGNYRVRPPLPEHLRLGWSYDKIKGEKRELLLSFARANAYRCPSAQCGNQYFSSLKNTEIHIGHRISQKWNSMNTGVADVHHPYNLYLSCSACNISLSEKYPSQIDQLINDMGTVGDWLISGLLEHNP
jgi:hypothetical protein